MTFKIPLQLADLESGDDDSSLSVKEIVDMSSEESIGAAWKDFQNQLKKNGLRTMSDQETFDLTYALVSYVKKSRDLNLTCKMCTCFTNAFTCFVTETDMSSQRSTLCDSTRASVYFTKNLVDVILSCKEFAASTGKTSKDVKVVRAIRTLNQLVDGLADILSSVTRFWECGVPEDSFLMMFLKISQKILSIEMTVSNKSAATSGANLLALLVHTFPSTSTSLSVSLQELVLAHSFSCSAVVQIVQILADKYENTQFVVELMNEFVSRDVDGSRDTSGVKNLASFVMKVSEQLPKMMYSNASILLPLLNCGNYVIRNAVINSLGELCVAFATKATSSGESYNETTRNTFLTILKERMYDVTAFTRSCCLKVWTRLCEMNAIPISRILPVTKIAIGRLLDKSAIVRKSAARYLQSVASCGLFGHDLGLTACQKRFEDAKTKLAQCEASEQSLAQKVLDGEDTQDSAEELTNARKSQSKIVEFYESLVCFVKMFEECSATICNMLHSENSTDVIEALRLIAVLHEERLEGVNFAAQAMLELVWSTTQEHRKAVVDTFLRLHIDGIPTLLSCARLISATLESSAGTLASLKAVIGILQKDQRVPTSLTSMLWKLVRSEQDAKIIAQSVFSKCEEEEVRQVRRGALAVVSMMCAADPSLALRGGRLQSVLKIALSTEAISSTTSRPDWILVEHACKILQSVQVEDLSTRLVDTILKSISSVLLYGLSTTSSSSHEYCDDSWYAAAEQSMNAAMYMCVLPSASEVVDEETKKHQDSTILRRPEEFFGNIVRRMIESVFGETSSEEKLPTIETWKLGHAIFVVGQVAVKVLIRAESLASLAKEIRVARASHELRKAKDGDSENKDDAIARQLGLHASSDFREDEHVASIAREGIIGRQLLGVFAPILLRLVSNESGLYDDEITLRGAAMISFCKFMCVSRTFCEKQLPLLFTVLQRKTESASMRVSAIVALGDLATRFPNELEPWNSRLYELLEDDDITVRKNVLMVLTHLVLNDMIKVKGCTHLLAKCLTDQDTNIKHLATQFFSEFASKSNNNIYNILPDTVGQLSADKSVDSATFRRVSRHLIQYVDKDWQFSSLITKICHRIGTTTCASQWNDYIYCLTLFRINENTFKAIVSSFKSYKNALSNDKNAHSLFSSGIVSKCKKVAASKPEQEVTINEWISQVENLSRDKLVSSKEDAEQNDEEVVTMMSKTVVKDNMTKNVVLHDENTSVLNVMVSSN